MEIGHDLRLEKAIKCEVGSRPFEGEIVKDEPFDEEEGLLAREILPKAAERVNGPDV